MINPYDNYPPGMIPGSECDRDRLRDEASDADEDPRTEWADWWALWCERREREESQRGRDGEL